MKFALFSATGAALLAQAFALTFEEVKEALEATKAVMESRLETVENELLEAFEDISGEIGEKINALDLKTEKMESLWQKTSGMYDFLDSKDPHIYQDILDTQFSSAGDLYEFLESRISPWYDEFDRLKIWDYKFYALVDSYDFLYGVVDDKNHELYDLADVKFEENYQTLETLSYKLDALAEERYSGDDDDDDDDSGPTTNGTSTVTPPHQNYERAQESINKHKELHEKHIQEAFEHRLQVAQNVATAKSKAQASFTSAVATDNSGLSAGVTAIVVVVGVTAFAALAVSMYTLRKNANTPVASDDKDVEAHLTSPEV